MKKLLFVAMIILVGVGIVILKPFEKSPSEPLELGSDEHTVLGQATDAKTVIFVPYWTIGSTPIEAGVDDELLYFGVAANKDGLITDDPGYEKLEDFVAVAPRNSKKFLTIRMLDNTSNAAVLKDKNAQSRIINESTALAQKYGFDGIVLDFESSSLSFDSIVKNISEFNQAFSQKLASQNKKYYVAVYGDTFYRARPYDISSIGKNSDKILIMAYDFHKARGNPGPNFPLIGKNQYGYDFEQMIQDYTKDASKAKLIPIFGMFGYDWKIDSSGKAVSGGSPISYNAIKSNYIDSCVQKDCKLNRKNGEPYVTYTDEEGEKHIIWFEDPNSIDEKKKYLQKQGINSYGYWAYSFY